MSEETKEELNINDSQDDVSGFFSTKSFDDATIQSYKTAHEEPGYMPEDDEDLFSEQLSYGTPLQDISSTQMTMSQVTLPSQLQSQSLFDTQIESQTILGSETPPPFSSETPIPSTPPLQTPTKVVGTPISPITPFTPQMTTSSVMQYTPLIKSSQETTTPYTQGTQTDVTGISTNTIKTNITLKTLGESITGPKLDALLSELGVIPEGDEEDEEDEQEKEIDENIPKTYQFIYPPTGEAQFVFFRIGDNEDAKYQYYDLMDPEKKFILKNINADNIKELVKDPQLDENVVFKQYKPGEIVVPEYKKTEEVIFKGVDKPLIAVSYVQNQIPLREEKMNTIRQLCNLKENNQIFEPKIFEPEKQNLQIFENINKLSPLVTSQTPSSLYDFLQDKINGEVEKMKYKLRKTDWLNSIVDSTHDELIEYIQLIVRKLDEEYNSKEATELSKNVITAAGSASQPKCHDEQHKLFRDSINYLQTKPNEPRVEWIMQSDAAYIGQYNLRPDIKTEGLQSASDLKNKLNELGVKNISIETGRGVNNFITDSSLNYVVYPTGMDAGNRMTEENYIKALQPEMGNLYVLKHNDPRLPFIKNILEGVDISNNIKNINDENFEDFMRENIKVKQINEKGIPISKGSVQKEKFIIEMEGIIQPSPTARICKIIPDYESGLLTYILFETNGIYFLLIVNGAVSVNNLCSMCGIAAKRGFATDEDCDINDRVEIEMYSIDVNNNNIEKLNSASKEDFNLVFKKRKLNNIGSEEKYMAVLACIKKDGDGRYVAYSKYLKDFFNTPERGQLCCTSLDILCINELVYNGVITLGCVKASKGQGKALPVNLYCPDARSSSSAQTALIENKKRVLSILLIFKSDIQNIVEKVFQNLRTQLETDKNESLDMVQFEVASSMLSNIDKLKEDAMERVNHFYREFFDLNNKIISGEEFQNKFNIYLPLMPTDLPKWIDDICMLHTFFTEYQDKIYSLVKPQDCFLIPNDSECKIVCSTDIIQPEIEPETGQDSKIFSKSIKDLTVSEKVKKRNFDGIYNCILTSLAGMLPSKAIIDEIDVHVVAFYTQMILAISKTNEQLNEELAYIYYQQLLAIYEIYKLCRQSVTIEGRKEYLHLEDIEKIENLIQNLNERSYIKIRKNTYLSDLQAAVPTKEHQSLIDFMSYDKYKERLKLYLKSHKIVRDVIKEICKENSDEKKSNKIQGLINKYHVLTLIGASIMRMHYYSFYKPNEWYNIIEGELYNHISNLSGKTIYEHVNQLVKSKNISKVFKLDFTFLEPPCLMPLFEEPLQKKRKINLPELKMGTDSDSETSDGTVSPPPSKSLFGKGGKTKKRKESKKRNKNTKRHKSKKLENKTKRRQTKRKKIMHKKVKYTHKNE